MAGCHGRHLAKIVPNPLAGALGKLSRVLILGNELIYLSVKIGAVKDLLAGLSPQEVGLFRLEGLFQREGPPHIEVESGEGFAVLSSSQKRGDCVSRIVSACLYGRSD